MYYACTGVHYFPILILSLFCYYVHLLYDTCTNNYYTVYTVHCNYCVLFYRVKLFIHHVIVSRGEGVGIYPLKT